MKKLFLFMILLLCYNLQGLKAQNFVSNGDFSSYSCAVNCDVTTFPNYPNPSNLTNWYALTGTPEIYAWIESAYMWDGTGSSASDESLIQVFSTPLTTSTCSYDLSIDAFHNNTRGAGGIIVELEDAFGVKLQILNTAVSNTTSQTFKTTFSIGNTFTKLIIRADAYSGFMDLVIDNVEITPTLPPVVDLQAPYINPEICKDGTIVLEVDNPNVYRWGLNGNYSAFPIGGGFWNQQHLTLNNTPFPGWPSTANTGTYNISCQIITAGGCTLTSNSVAISVVDVNNALAVSGTLPLCPGASVDLTGAIPNPVQTYQWEADFGSGFIPIPGGPGHILNNVTTPGNYRFVTTSQNGGCTETSNIVSVVAADPLTITSPSPNFITNGVNVLQVDLSGNPPVYTAFTWYRNGVPVMGPCSCPIFTPTEPGEYSVKAIGACGEELSNLIDFTTDCGNPNLNPMSTAIISGGSIYNDPNGYLVSGTLVIPSGGVTFQGTTLVMDLCSRIEVPIGSSLTLDKTQVVGCDDWEGIIVYGDPNMTRTNPITAAHGELILESSFISDAKVALYMHEGGFVTVRRSRLENNEVHMGFDDYLYPNMSQNGENKFAKTQANSCSHSIYTGPVGSYDHAVFVVKNIDISFIQNEFLRNEAVLMNTSGGLTTNNRVSLYLEKCEAIQVLTNNFLAESEHEVYVNLGDNLFVNENNFYGHLNNPYAYNIVNGGYFYRVGNASEINGNTILNCQYGFEFYDFTSGTATMEQNLFEANNFALLVAPFENPLVSSLGANNSIAQINLDIHCNKFNFNDYAIAGSGNLKDQGAFNVDASNLFNSNVNWDAVWRPTLAAPNYYYIPSPGPAITGSPLPLDNSPTSTSFNLISTNPGAQSCFGSWKRDMTSLEEEVPTEQASVEAYPNPFGSQFNISLPEQNTQYEIVVYDVTGKVIHQETVYATKGQLSVETSSWEAGVYFAQVRSDSGIQETVKLVKMK